MSPSKIASLVLFAALSISVSLGSASTIAATPSPSKVDNYFRLRSNQIVFKTSESVNVSLMRSSSTKEVFFCTYKVKNPKDFLIDNFDRINSPEIQHYTNELLDTDEYELETVNGSKLVYGYAGAPLSQRNSYQYSVRAAKGKPGVYLIESFILNTESKEKELTAQNGCAEANKRPKGISRYSYATVIVSDLAMDIRSHQNALLVRALDNSDSATGINVSTFNLESKKKIDQGQTDKNGIVEFKNIVTENGVFVLAAKPKTEQISVMKAHYGFNPTAQNPIYRIYAYSDRPIYKRDDKVQFKGIVRQLLGDTYVTVKDLKILVSFENETQTLTTDEFGAFSSSIDLASVIDDNFAKTYGYIQFGTPATVRGRGASAAISFQIQDYREPSFKVSASLKDNKSGITSQGQKVEFEVMAETYDGTSVPNARVAYTIQETVYPIYRPWPWLSDIEPSHFDGARSFRPFRPWTTKVVSNGEVKTNREGKVIVSFQPQNDGSEKVTEQGGEETIALKGATKHYKIVATVTDLSNESQTGSFTAKVTPADFEIKLELAKNFYSSGEVASLKIKTTNFKGESISKELIVTVTTSRGEYTSTLTEVITTDKDGNNSFDHDISESGLVSFSVTDKDGHALATETAQAIGTEAQESDRFKIIAESGAGKYKVGDEAKLLILSPVKTGKALFTLGAKEIHSSQIVDIQNGMAQLTFKLGEKDAPSIGATVSLVKDHQAMRGGVLLSVLDTSKKLDVNVVVAAQSLRKNKDGVSEVDPGSKVAFDVILTRKAKNSFSRDIKANTALAVINEAVFALAPANQQDIFDFFHGSSKRYVNIRNQNSLGVDYGSERLKKGGARFGGSPAASRGAEMESGAPELADEASNDAAAAPITVRQDFRDTAVWLPNATSQYGQVRFEAQMPDDITSWKVITTAIDQASNAGMNETKLITTKDFTIRANVPKGATYTQGDIVTINSQVKNNTDEDKTVEVILSVKGAVIVSATTKSIFVKAYSSVPVQWEVEITDIAKAEFTMTARGTSAATGKMVSDAELRQGQVLPYGLKEVKSGSSVLLADSGKNSMNFDLGSLASIPMVDGTAKAELVLTSSLAGTLFTSLDYLVQFPYGCIEQTMSRFLPTLYVKGAAKKVGIDLKSDTLTDEAIEKGLARLQSAQIQSGDCQGGWGWWPGAKKCDTAISAYVAYGLTLADKLGDLVPAKAGDSSRKEMLKSAIAFLSRTLKINSDIENGKEGNQLLALDINTKAYIQYVLALNNAISKTEVTDFAKELVAAKSQNDYAVAQGLLALQAQHQGVDRALEIELLKLLDASAITAGGLHWANGKLNELTTRWQDDAIETTAYAFKAFSNAESYFTPKNKLDGAVRWLVDSRKNGTYWNSTRDTATVIFALTDFMAANKAELKPNVSATVKVNGIFISTKSLEWKNTFDAKKMEIDVPALATANQSNIEITKNGKGSLYASLVLKYVKEVKPLLEKDHGLKVSREYFKLTKKTILDATPDSSRDWVGHTRSHYYEAEKVSGGSFNQGDMILSVITVESEHSQKYIKAEDFMPAGVKVISQEEEWQTGLGDIRDKDGKPVKFAYTWAARSDRYEKTAFFLDGMPAQSKAQFKYAFKVQMPATKAQSLPALAELMYYPETRGNSAESNFSFKLK